MSGESSQPWQAKHTASRLQRTTTMTRPSVVLAASGPLCVDTWNTKRQTFEQQASSRKRRGGRSGRQAKPPQKSSKEYAIGGPRFAMGMRSGPSLFLPTVKSRDFVKNRWGRPFFILFQSNLVWRGRSVRLANPSRSHTGRRCARKARTDVRVHLWEEVVKSTQVSSHHLGKQGLRAATQHTCAAYAPSKCTRCH